MTHTTVTYFRPNPAEHKDSGSFSGSTTTNLPQAELRTIIINAMRSTPDIKVDKLAEICKLSVEGVRYHIKILKKEGYITRIGHEYGHWEVLKLEDQ